MIRSSGVIRKGRLRPALAELVPDGALMIGSEPFQLRFICPHHPTVQRFIELTRTNRPLTNPVHEGPSWDLKPASQFAGPRLVLRVGAAAVCGVGCPGRSSVDVEAHIQEGV